MLGTETWKVGLTDGLIKHRGRKKEQTHWELTGKLDTGETNDSRKTKEAKLQMIHRDANYLNK